MKLKQHFADKDIAELRVFAQNQGVLIDDNLSKSAYASALASAMTDAEHVREVWRDLPPQAREALSALLVDDKGLPILAFERRFGELRRIGVGRLQMEKPWKKPRGPGEVLWWLGWLVRGFKEVGDELVEFVSIPEDIAPLLPADARPPSAPPLPQPIPSPATEKDLGQMLLDDLGALLAYVQTHDVKLRVDGRWRYQDLRGLLPRLRLSRIRAQPLEAGGPLHLIFLAAKTLGLLVERQKRHKFGRALRPWLALSRAEQMASLFQVWRESKAWNDLCLTPGLHCQEGAWRNQPRWAREALLTQLARVQAGEWYGLDDFIAMIYEFAPDFQRPDANYDTWYIQNEAGEFLRGFDQWHDVEGELIRFIWRGPLFWLGAVALDEEGQAWRLTPQGHGFLHGAEPNPPSDAPILRIDKEFIITLAPHIGLWDHLRVALFTFWQASEPVYRYQITQRGLQRAKRRGVSAGRVLAFLDRASGGQIPNNVRRALQKFDA